MISALEALTKSKAYTVANGYNIRQVNTRVEGAAARGECFCYVPQNELLDVEAKYLRDKGYTVAFEYGRVKILW